MPDALLRRTHLLRLPTSIRRYAQAACTPQGTLQDLGRVVDYGLRRPTDTATLPVHYYNIDPAWIPASDDPETYSEAQMKLLLRAHLSLGTLATCLYHEMVRTAADWWPRIRPWIAYWSRHHDSAPAELDSELRYAKVLSQIIDHQPPLEPDVFTSPGVLEVIMRAWTALPRGESLATRATCCGIITRCLSSESLQVDDPVVLERIVDGTGGSMDTLARAVLSFIDISVQDVEEETRRRGPLGDIPATIFISSMLIMLQFLRRVDANWAIRPNKPLAHRLGVLGSCLVARGIVPRLTKLFRVLIKSPASHDHDALLTECIRLVLFLFITEPVTKHVVACLKNDHLLLLVDIAAGPHPAGKRDDIKTLFCDTFPALLVRADVVRAFEKARERAASKIASRGFKTSQIYSAWKEFNATLSRRVAILDGIGNEPRNQACSNLEASPSFMAPASSELTLRFFYCSPACQTADWTAGGHRQVCSLHYRLFLHSRAMGFTARDRAFQRALLDYDSATQRWLMLAVQLAAYIRQEPSDSDVIITVLRYETGDTDDDSASKIVATQISNDGEDLTDVDQFFGDLDPAPRDLQPAWRDLVARARASGGKMELHAMSYSPMPAGAKSFWLVPMYTNWPTINQLRELVPLFPGGVTEENWDEVVSEKSATALRPRVIDAPGLRPGRTHEHLGESSTRHVNVHETTMSLPGELGTHETCRLYASRGRKQTAAAPQAFLLRAAVFQVINIFSSNCYAPRLNRDIPGKKPSYIKAGRQRSSVAPPVPPRAAQRTDAMPGLNTTRIVISTNGEHYFVLEVTGARSGASIRERMFSKLAIPDDRHAYYSIYQSEVGQFGMGGALTDSRLFDLCHERGDASGSLKFFVSTAPDRPPSEPTYSYSYNPAIPYYPSRAPPVAAYGSRQPPQATAGYGYRC
ncbi:hypothetical protein MKEN_00497100 [Mycena kentingensis (nom. inval.)]|nr:hypothetical protein MKEN_00497100 [Mycena kentingensis (nom. inval.)]